MSKPTKLTSIKPKYGSGGVPFVVLVGIFGLGLLGGVLGWLLYYWWGDII